MNRRHEDIRYNDNTRGKGKHKKSAKKNLRRAMVGSIALFMFLGFNSEYSKTDEIMTREEGIEITQVYSPSGGIDTVIHGEKQHSMADVIDRMIEDAKSKIFSYEEKYAETDEINNSVKRG